MAMSQIDYWGRCAEIFEDALKEIAALPDVRCDEAPGVAQHALAKAKTLNIAYWRKSQ